MPAFLAAVPYVATGAVASYRAYQAYRLARTAQALAAAGKALDQMEAAQSAAKPDDKAEEKTDSQAKADAAASADCKDCNEHENCEKWRNDVKKSLYEAKKPKALGGDPLAPKGLAQRLCEWLNGTPPDNHNHANEIDGLIRNLKDTFKKLDNKRHFRCQDSSDLKAEAEKYIKPLSPGEREATKHLTARPDFQQFCYDQAVELAKKFLPN